MKIKQLFKKLTVATADQGYAIFPFITFPQQSGGSGQMVTTINRMLAAQVVLPFRLKVTDIVIYVRVASPAARFGCGIYSIDGGTLLLETGAIDVSTIAKKKVTLGTPVTLNAGAYWLAWTANNVAVRIQSSTLSTYTAELFADTNPQYGKSSNNGISGVLPATLGTITYEFTVESPIVLMKP